MTIWITFLWMMSFLECSDVVQLLDDLLGIISMQIIQIVAYQRADFFFENSD